MADSTPSVLRGTGIIPGVFTGQVATLPEVIQEPPAGRRLAPGADVEVECQRLITASTTVSDALCTMAEAATGDVADVLNATASIATDPTLVSDTERRIRTDHLVAERALWEAAEVVADQFAKIGGYLAERIWDIFEVRDRIIAELSGQPAPGLPVRPEPYVLVAHDIPPAMASQLNPDLVGAIVTSAGSATSHTAIIARALGIIAVVGVESIAHFPADGETALVDGGTGKVIFNPSAADIEDSISRPVRTPSPQIGEVMLADGTPVELLANVGDARDAAAAAAAHAHGVGLFRTEFCFLNRAHAPTVDEQVRAYRSVLAHFPGKKVIVRTLDAGSDKPLPFLNAADEPNSALGARGYRAMARRPELLHDQLMAIAQAAAAESAEVWVMAPMISTRDEARDFAAIAHEHGLSPVGVMAEVPAAVLEMPSVLAEVDFASVGTNDLAQYVMAADRLHNALGSFLDPWQPAVLRMVSLAAQAGQETGRPVGLCGEAASYADLAAVFIGLGVTSLSMAPRAMSDVAAVLQSVSIDDCRRLADLALDAGSAALARDAVRAQLPLLLDLGL